MTIPEQKKGKRGKVPILSIFHTTEERGIRLLL